MHIAGMTLDNIKVMASVISGGHVYRIVRFSDAAKLGLFGEAYQKYKAVRDIFSNQFVAVETELDGTIISALPYMNETVEGCLYRTRLSADDRYIKLQKRLCRLLGTPDATEALTIMHEMEAIEKEAAGL